MATQKMSLQTSLLGYSYVASEPGIVKKLLWVLVVFAAYAFATYFIQDNIQENISSTDVTSTNSTTASLQDIHFPSAVLCNINQVSRAFINSINVDSAEGWSVLENQFLHDNSELNEKFLVTGVEDPIYKETRGQWPFKLPSHRAMKASEAEDEVGVASEAKEEVTAASEGSVFLITYVPMSPCRVEIQPSDRIKGSNPGIGFLVIKINSMIRSWDWIRPFRDMSKT